MWYTKDELERGMGRIIGRATTVYESISRARDNVSERFQTCGLSEYMGKDMEPVAAYNPAGKLT